MRNLRALGIIGLATIGLTAACGGSSESKGTGSGNPVVVEQAGAEPAAAKPSRGLKLDSVRKDPCQMVTKSEAEAIFGRTAQTPSKGFAVGAVEASCDYAVEATRPSEVRTMTVSIMFSPERVGRGLDGKKFMEGARKGAVDLGVPAESVGGLGDEAFCFPTNPGASIFARTGDIVLAVGGTVGDCALTRQFAEKALARL